MSRTEKLRKLGNAIRAYRGATSKQPGDPNLKWVRTPQLSKFGRINELLKSLGLGDEERTKALIKIDSFKFRREFEVWMKELSEPKKDGTGL